RRPFFAMKLLKGRTLTDLLRARSGLAEDRPRFLGIYEKVCQTLAYAHARGVIHRELKPANIMVGNLREVQAMDSRVTMVLAPGHARYEQGRRSAAPDRAVGVVGLARSGSDAYASLAGSFRGTPGYMAPEQGRGEVALVDERAEVFGLGAILCEILTG